MRGGVGRNRRDVLEVGDVHARVVVEDDAGVEDVARVKYVFDLAHELHALLAPF